MMFSNHTILHFHGDQVDWYNSALQMLGISFGTQFYLTRVLYFLDHNIFAKAKDW